MQNRLRFLQGAAALLYLGPLLAGLGGFGWAVVPVFAAIFLLWQFILRPHHWPRSRADWQRPEAPITVLTQVVVQVLLVAVCFGIGRGIGGVLAALPPFPLMLPIAVSFLSIPLGRLLWNPWRADMAVPDLDDALADLQDGASAVDELDLKQARTRMAGRLVEELARLPADTPPDTLSAHLSAMAAEVGHDALRAALMDPVYDGTALPVHRRAVVVHATDARVVTFLAGTTYPLSVFNALSHAPDLQLFANRCAAMIAEAPATLAECPDPEAVAAMARSVPQAAAALTALAAALGAAQGPV